MSQQPCGTIKIVLRLFRDHPLQITYSRGEISQLNLGYPTAVERVRRVGAGRNRFVVTFARPDVLPFFEITISQLLIIACRRIVEDDRLKLADSAAARKDFERLPQKAKVGQHLNENINNRAETAADEDDP